MACTPTGTQPATNGGAFEITLLDFEFDPEVRGDRIVVRRRNVPLVSRSAVSRPVESPSCQEWVFEAGE